MRFVSRPYQNKAIEDIRATYANGCRRVFYSLATGGGKTHIFSSIIRQARAKGRQVLVVAHREELVVQAHEKLKDHDTPSQMVTRGKTYGPRKGQGVTVAMVQTLRSWVKNKNIVKLKPPDLIIVDEAHLATSRSYVEVLDRYPDAYRLLVSATPWRLDGKGFDHLADKLIIGPQTPDLIEQGYLVRPETYTGLCAPEVRLSGKDYNQKDLEEASNTVELNGDLVANYEAYAKGLPFIVFASGVKHSLAIKAKFEAAGWRIAHVDGKTDPSERKRTLAALERGELDGVTNCGVFVEGLDITRIACVIIARRTKSLNYWLQACGRGLRLHKDKTRCVIIDSGACVAEHGLVEAHRDWSLEGELKKLATAKAETKRQLELCLACGYDFEGTKKDSLFCPFCGYPTKQERTIKHNDMMLIKAQASDPVFQLMARYERIRTANKKRGHKKYTHSAWYHLCKALYNEGHDGPAELVKALGWDKVPPGLKQMSFEQRQVQWPSVLWVTHGDEYYV